MLVNVGDRLDFAAIDVDAVAHRLEREERDADGEDDGVDERVRAEHLVACGREEVVHVQLDARKLVEGVQEEVGILVVAKNEQVDDDDNDHQELLFPVRFRLFNPLAYEEVRYNAEGENADVAAARLVVEEEARGEQERVAHQDAVLDDGQQRENDREEAPEIKLRKEQRAVRVERERAREVGNQIV